MHYRIKSLQFISIVVAEQIHTALFSIVQYLFPDSIVLLMEFSLSSLVSFQFNPSKSLTISPFLSPLVSPYRGTQCRTTLPLTSIKLSIQSPPSTPVLPRTLGWLTPWELPLKQTPLLPNLKLRRKTKAADPKPPGLPL